ncbi:hypothetical protein GTY65_02235 [Streptomyces sp. SID8379]|nr:hypothetical protein [Streptomyces sp. SID8379]
MSPLSGLLDELMRPVVEPLAEQLEFVTGDPEGLQEAADLWKKQAEELRDLIADQRRDRSDLAHEWTGEAADAFMGQLDELESEFEAEASDMEGHGRTAPGGGRRVPHDPGHGRERHPRADRMGVDHARGFGRLRRAHGGSLGRRRGRRRSGGGLARCHPDREPCGPAGQIPQGDRGRHEGTQGARQDEQVQHREAVDLEARR